MADPRCGLPHLDTPGNSITAQRRWWESTYQAEDILLSPHMTLLAPRPDRILTPHTFVVPVVRELPTSLDSNPAAGISPSSSGW